MACAAGPHVLLGLAKRGRRGGERAIWEGLGDFWLDGFVRGVFAGRGVQLLEVAVSDRESREEERRKLEAAGWEPRGRGPKTLWRNPADGRWYAQYRAIIILRRQRRGMEEESEP
jgi:hypothetical protein